ncbi:copper-transporting ATPase HMA4-like [Malania oleifera]|uniref:copper-transporting ATPase HMA4-like n=1 Tax=Malania oleifera TaxID=397392 RepID=UPI0025AEB309|nr:copper-transporting ATPase HMA4-like [Malania oleifera]
MSLFKGPPTMEFLQGSKSLPASGVSVAEEMDKRGTMCYEDEDDEKYVEVSKQFCVHGDLSMAPEWQILKDRFPPEVEVLYVGSLKAEIEPAERKEVAQFLLKKFGCVPTFLSNEIQDKFYHGFCKYYLWPLFHYILPVSPINDAQFNLSQWHAYVRANQIFANKVLEVLNNPYEDFVLIHDYHLMAMSSYLRKKIHQAIMIKARVEGSGFQVDEFSESSIAACRLKIKGMTCTGCAESVERALLMVDGVKKAMVGLALEEAKVYFDPNVTNTNHIIEAIEDTGLEADLISSGNDVNKVHLKLEGVSSLEEMNFVQSSLEFVEGVNQVEMDMEGSAVTVSYDPNLTDPRSLLHCIQEAGRDAKRYNATLFHPPRRREREQEHEIQIYRNQFFWSYLFSVPVFVLSMVLPMLHPYGNCLDYMVYNTLTVGMLLRWILCTPV